MATTTRVLDANVNGTVYTTNANGALEAIDTCHSGATAPTDELANGKFWLDTTTTPGILKIYNNATWEVVHSGTVDINGGTIDGTVIGGTTPAAGTFTALTSNGIDDNAAATAVTIDASGNVGVGTASPDTLLNLAGADTAILRLENTDTSLVAEQLIGGIDFYANDGSTNGTGAKVQIKGIATSAAGTLTALTFGTSGSATATAAEAMRIDASGNVGIGTAGPTENLHISSGFPAIKLDNTDAGGHSWRIASGDTGSGFAGNLQVYNEDTATVAMMIDSSGRTWIGGSTMPAGVTGLKLNVIGGTNDLMASYSTSTGAKTHWLFNNPNGTVGTIRTSASTTSYNTTSDHRLKENITAIQGAADIVKAMRPCTYTFKAGGDWADGFIAHELQELHPVAVSGEKDAMRDEEYEVTPAVLDEDGAVVTEAVMGTRSVPDYQGVDYSKLTPILTAALQEALNKIDALEARVAALEV